MIRKFCLTLAVISAASLSMVSAQQTAKVTASGIGYLEYLPQGYKSSSDKYPLVISLHGIKEKGTSSTDKQKVLADLNKVDNVGLPKYVMQGEKYPFILISPQLKKDHGTWSGAYVMQVLNHVKKHLRVDERRIYLTGLSLGGFGVWKTAGDFPNVFAAIAPICAGGNALNKANDIAAANLPIWGFHGGRDHVVSYNVTVKMINAVNSAPKKPNPLAKTTIFPGMGHVIWDKAYKETSVLNWMLSHRKGSAPSGGSGNDYSGGSDDGNRDDDKDDHDDDDDDDNDDGKDKSKDKGKKDDRGKEQKEKNSKNILPVASAGPDRVLTLPTNETTVSASASDKDGKIVSYEWTQTYGNRASMSGETSDKVRIYNLKKGSAIFRLRVKDNDGGIKDDYFKITVKGSSDQNKNTAKGKNQNKSTKKSNILPKVHAGADKVITLPTNSINIRAQAADKDGKIVSYEWAQTYGKRANISGGNSSSVRINNLREGPHIFRVRVRDNDGGVADDYFKITVKAKKNNKTASNSGSNSREKTSSGKSGPVANAGPDLTVKSSVGMAQLIGSAKSSNGKIVSYQWKVLAGPGNARIQNARSARAKVTNLKEGRYYISLTVRDENNARHEDKLAIRVTGS